MEGTTVAAIVSFAGFVGCLALYALLPFPHDAAWPAGAWWLSACLLGVGSVCFLVFLVTGLITFLNRGSAPPDTP